MTVLLSPARSGADAWRPKLWAVAGIAVLTAAVLAGKITWVIGGFCGLLVALAVFRWPLVGVIGVVFAGTSLQVSGSEYATGLPLSLSRLFGIVTAAALAFHIYTGRSRLTYAPAMKPLFWFMSIVVLSTILQPDTHESVEGLLKLTQVCVVYVLIGCIAVDRKSVKIVCVAVTATCVVASVIAVAEHFLPSLHLSVSDPRLAHATLGAVVDEDSAESGDIARVSGGVGDANYFAYTVAAAFPLTLYWWRRAGTVRMKGLVLAVALAQGIGLTLSYTRTGFLGLAAATVYLALRRRLPILPLVLLGFLALGLAAIYVPPALIERMTSTRYMEEGSTPVRRDLLYAGWHLFEQQPMFGYGYGQFGPCFVRYRRAGDTRSVIEEMVDSGFEEIHDLRCHNTYLEVAIEYGLLGLIPFMWFLARLLGDLRDAERKKRGTDDAELAIVLTAGLIAFYTCAILAHSKILNIFWILAGLTAALRRVALTEEPAAGAVGTTLVRNGGSKQ